MMASPSAFIIPNLPGMTPNKQSWVYREKDGFKKSLSRPNSAIGLRSVSPNFERSGEGMFRNMTGEISNSPFRPMTAQPRSNASLHQTDTFATFNNTTRPSTAGAMPSRPSSAAVKLPRYVETDRQIARFYAHFHQERPFEKYGPLGSNVVERMMPRFMAILVYIFDGTVEINEPKDINSGMSQGTFYRRGVLYKDNGKRLNLQDLIPGNVVSMLGREFHITDADQFTRDYFKRELNIILPPALPRPEPMTRDLGAQYATGLGMKASFSKDSFNTMSTDYLNTKVILEKTNRFLQYDGKVLRFLCVEVSDWFPPYFPALEESLARKGGNTFAMSLHGFVASAAAKKFCIAYYLSSNEVELVVQKNKGERDTMSADEPRLILKKTQLPRNWREVQDGEKASFYEPSDLQCGRVVDVFGRLFLLLKCDSFTQDYYQRQGVEQVEVPIVAEDVPKIVQPIPELGDGTLPIGSQADTLATVYGMPKVTKDMAKVQRNQNRFIRCKAALLSNDPIDQAREFLITFYLEDDSIQVYEEKKRNSGIWSGTFLRRGKYINEYPNDSSHNDDSQENSEPRPFRPTDIYLGNIIYLNGSQFQIIEMDNMSLNFCETYPNEFPMSDTFRIIGSLMVKVVSKKIDLRPVFLNADKQKQGWLDSENFIRVLDSLNLTEHLNDQELLTLMRRFKDGEKVWYNEMSDLLSHVYFTHRNRSSTKKLLRDVSSWEQFLRTARSRTVQWRRSLRKDHFTLNGKVTMDEFAKLFQKQDLELPEHLLQEIVSKFRLSDEAANPILKDLNRLHEVDRVYEELDSKVPSASSRPVSRQASAKNVIDLARLQELRKRKASMVSLLRQKVDTANADPRAKVPTKLNYRTIVIDYNRLCDEIYICDWA